MVTEPENTLTVPEKIQSVLSDDKTLFPYQIDDITKLTTEWKNKSVFLGLEMGLGKTIISILTWEILKYEKILIICPANVRFVWESEIREWSEGYKSFLYDIQTITKSNEKIITKPVFPIIITSYDLSIAPDIAQQLLSFDWDLIVFDECHCLGNPKSKRTKMCCGNLFKRSKRSLFLSGSIQRNRIINVWPVFRTLCPEKISTFWKFAYRYNYIEQGEYGIKFLGGRNLEELGKIATDNFLIRRKKAWVLKDLPEKIEQKIYITDEKIRAEIEKQSFLLGDELENSLLTTGVMSENLATLRRQIGEAKIPFVVDECLELLGLGSSEEGINKLVVFCHHRSVFGKLQKELSKHVKVYGFLGGAGNEERRGNVERFQSGSFNEKSIFLGTFAAAEGITLTAASHIVFAEMSWSLSQNEQAIDRLHRIGQKNTVYIKYLLFKNSLDEIVYRVYKRKMVDKQKAFK